MDATSAIMTGSTVATALASVGILKYVREARADARIARRLLLGEETVDDDEGLVGMVRTHRRVLRREGLFDPVQGPREREDRDG